MILFEQIEGYMASTIIKASTVKCDSLFSGEKIKLVMYKCIRIMQMK